MVNLEITSCHCAWAYLIHSPRKQTCVCVFWGVILLYVMLLRFSKHQKEKFCDGRKKVCVCVCVCASVLLYVWKWLCWRGDDLSPHGKKQQFGLLNSQSVFLCVCVFCVICGCVQGSKAERVNMRVCVCVCVCVCVSISVCRSMLCVYCCCLFLKEMSEVVCQIACLC